MNIVMALIALGFLIFIHELGHFWAARATGVRVEEFAIGFGPAIFKYKSKGVQYRLNWVPLGGYVRMYGEDNPEAAAAPDNFNNRPIPARILIICAGVIMNMIGAFVILAFLYNFYGAPTDKLSVHDVLPNSPAQEAGLKAGDQIVKADDQVIKKYDTFRTEVTEHENLPMSLGIIRDGKEMTLQVTPRVITDKVAVGFTPNVTNVFVKEGGFGANTAKAFKDTGNLAYMMFDGFKKLVTGGVSFNELGGPVEIVRLTGQASETGTPHFLYIVALLSVNLAVLNIMPFPALDGGRLVFLILEWIRRGKRIPVEREASINFIGILFLLTLMIIVTFKDVFNIFSQP